MGKKVLYVSENDSYEKFLEGMEIDRDKFIKWGLDSIIYIEADIESTWKKIIREEYWKGNKKDVVKYKSFIRVYGRNAAGTPYFIELNKRILKVISGIDAYVVKDSSNNSKPPALLKEMTGCQRNEASSRRTPIYNYQVSHIFGRTKNVLLFTAPWNVCYTPKIIDPLTGHETYKESKIVKEFKKAWGESVFKKFEYYINEYNKILDREDVQRVISDYKTEIISANNLEEDKKKQLLIDIDNAFSKITKSCIYIDEVAMEDDKE
jgi:hypothetical protein